jgi:hypothetical protein
MKFKNWLQKIEEASGGQRFRPSGGSGAVSDTSSQTGITGIFGRPGTTLSTDKIVPGVLGASGKSLEGSMRRKGLEQVPSAHIDNMPTSGAERVIQFSLPLQSPILNGNPVLNIGSGSYSSSIMINVENVVKKPETDPRVRLNGQLNPNDSSKFQLYTINDDGIAEYQRALNFTKALMHIMAINEMEKLRLTRYNLQKPEIKERTIEKDKHYDLICVFSFTPDKGKIQEEE